jgi:hypothetical protein
MRNHPIIVQNMAASALKHRRKFARLRAVAVLHGRGYRVAQPAIA